MGILSRKTATAEIGRTVAPTPAQAKRYSELRDSGKSPLEATRIVREEAHRER